MRTLANDLQRKGIRPSGDREIIDSSESLTNATDETERQASSGTQFP
jgi:hypothetical protein